MDEQEKKREMLREIFHQGRHSTMMLLFKYPFDTQEYYDRLRNIRTNCAFVVNAAAENSIDLRIADSEAADVMEDCANISQSKVSQ